MKRSQEISQAENTNKETTNSSLSAGKRIQAIFRKHGHTSEDKTMESVGQTSLHFRPRRKMTPKRGVKRQSSDTNTVIILGESTFNDKAFVDYGKEIKNFEDPQVEAAFIQEGEYGRLLQEARDSVPRHYQGIRRENILEILDQSIEKLGKQKVKDGGATLKSAAMQI